MATMLGIETATDVCSVAVAADGVVRCTISVDRPRLHAERLVPMIDEALRSVGIEPPELDAVAVSAGPGSYTGLRIGVSSAKGICVATGARFVPVSSLAALATVAHAPEGTVVIAAFRARRDEVYAAAFREGLEPIGEPFAGAPRDAVRTVLPVGSAPYVLVGDGATQIARFLRREGVEHVHRVTVRPSATGVVRLALATLETADRVDVERFEPYYLRDFTARPASGSAFDRLPF